MMNNKIDLIELKHNIEMLRMTVKSTKAASELSFNSDYAEGMANGYKQASDNFDRYIKRIEKIMEGVNIYE